MSPYTTGGAGSRGGRGKDCFQDGAIWSRKCRDTGRYTGRAPNGPSGYRGSSGTGKVKIITVTKLHHDSHQTQDTRSFLWY